MKSKFDVESALCDALESEFIERHVRFYGVRDSEVEDVVMDCVATAMKARYNFDERKSAFKTWLSRLVRSVVYDKYRADGAKKRDRSLCISLESLVEEEGFSAEEIMGEDSGMSDVLGLHFLHRALMLMNSEEVAFLELFVAGDESFQEVAAQCEVSVATIKYKTLRSLDALRSKFYETANENLLHQQLLHRS